MNEIYEAFQCPTAAYRGKPFWAWNGELDKEELLRQIHVMKEMGFGGFFMHSRTGLRTEYLGEKWFQLIQECTEEAEKLGMEPLIYDEDRWPSGSAGGIVTKDPKYRRKYLTLFIGAAPKLNEGTVAVFRGKVDGVKLFGRYERITPEETEGVTLQEDECFLSFCMRQMRKQSVFNGYTDLDRLSLEATQAFIRVTHEQYREKCGDSFKKLRGVFTDEPTHGPVFSDFGDAGEEQYWSLPWTDDLAEMFQRTFGFDLIERLPELYLLCNGKSVSKIKWQYMELIQQLFIDRFLKPIQQWSRDNDMILTGHFVNEDSLMSQTVPLGSMLRSYSYMDQPGMDCLTDCRYIPWAAKVLESAARQNGQKWKLTELYGATGWHMRFEDYKYVGDWQAVLGVNVRCPHLSWYTMEGEAKRDYPGTFLHQATWYKEHERLETYFARLSYVASIGKPVCHTLVLHPVESLWCQIYPHWAKVLDAAEKPIQKLEKQFEQMFSWLMETHVDFDYGDEGVLAERGKIVLKDGHSYLQVGDMLYDRVVISGSLNIRESTYRLLENFSADGGTLIFFGAAPRYISCERDERCRTLAERNIKLPFRRSSVQQYFGREQSVLQVLDPKAKKDLYLQLRKCENGFFAVIFNHSRKKAYLQIPFEVSAAYQVELWDCFSGERHLLPVENGTVKLDFASGQERVLCLRQGCETEKITEKKLSHNTKEYALTQIQGYVLDEKNIFVLDKAELIVDGQLIETEGETLELDKKLRMHVGLEARGGEMLQPWVVRDIERPIASVSLKYRFTLEALPKSPVQLAMEPMSGMKISINGRENMLFETPLRWIDRCFKVYEIDPTVLITGENVLQLTADYTQTSGLENLYLLGDFGVFFRENGRPVIGAMPENIQIGDITKQGFPFYSGKITYRFRLPKPAEKGFTLRLPEIGGSCALVSYAKKTQMVPWSWQTVYWPEEKNERILSAEVVLNRRNTFGPLHHFPVVQPYVSPDSFVCDDAENYALYPMGLMKAPRIKL